MFRDRPMICLVTDRRRLVDPSAPFVRMRTALVDLAKDAAEAGVSLFQIRERDLEAAQLVELTSSIVDATKGSATRVLVNDRIDVACAGGAAGVHLRGDSIPPRAARVLGPSPFLIGRSVHGLEDARNDAADADYLIAGTMFPTLSKPLATRFLGSAGFREIVQAVEVPILAIGGITMDRVDDVAASGAAGIAAIGLFLPGPMPLREVVRDVRARFDTSGRPPEREGT